MLDCGLAKSMRTHIQLFHKPRRLTNNLDFPVIYIHGGKFEVSRGRLLEGDESRVDFGGVTEMAGGVESLNMNDTIILLPQKGAWQDFEYFTKLKAQYRT